MSMGAKCWRLRALSPLWTGDANGKNDRLITTGLLGSIRWWFEVLVRGLGGGACDPTRTRCQDRSHCVVCELFGCTGWARKFRFDVLDDQAKAQRKQIQKDDAFQLSFTPLRPVGPQEWALLDATIRLIADYGAIGGKTVLKPSDESNRQGAAHHRDYGLVEVEHGPDVDTVGLAGLRIYVCNERWRTVEHGGFAWASLTNFWCTFGPHLGRQSTNDSTFNVAIDRPEPKNQASRGDSWLAGRRAGEDGGPESKKVFSFKGPARTFGFVDPPVLSQKQVFEKLRLACPEFDLRQVAHGDRLLETLFNGADGSVAQ